MRIGNCEIGSRTLIIAEVGSNHCGDPELARRSLIAAAESGADAVKFQMYDPNKLVGPTCPVLSYITQTQRTQRERFKSLCLPKTMFPELAKLARQKGVMFLVTAFDEDAVSFLDPLVPAFKVASGDLTHVRLLRAVAAQNKPLLVSTGMATMEEIDRAVKELPLGRLVLMHCVGAYPTPPEEVNLHVIGLLRERYGTPVGWSDHTKDGSAAVAAVAMGAAVVEKHFILSKELPAADTALSADPKEFKKMVEAIRTVEQMKGRPQRHPTKSEEYFREMLRRSVHASCDIRAGCAITSEMLIALRPCPNGAIPATEIENIIGRISRRTILAETVIQWDDLVN